MWNGCHVHKMLYSIGWKAMRMQDDDEDNQFDPAEK